MASSRDIARTLARATRAERRLRHVPSQLERLIKQVKLLVELCRAYANGSYRDVPWSTIATAAAALGYFVLPADLVPDFLPGTGFLDDASVLAMALAGIRRDLTRFCRFRGYDEHTYFA